MYVIGIDGRGKGRAWHAMDERLSGVAGSARFSGGTEHTYTTVI